MKVRVILGFVFEQLTARELNGVLEKFAFDEEVCALTPIYVLHRELKQGKRARPTNPLGRKEEEREGAARGGEPDAGAL